MMLINTIRDTKIIDKTVNIFFGFLYQAHIRRVNNVKYEVTSGSPNKWDLIGKFVYINPSNEPTAAEKVNK